MRVEKLTRISPDKVTVKFRSYMRYSPQFRSNYITKRKQSSFLYILEGGYEFRYDGGELSASSGDVVYLPEGSAYGYKLLSDTAEFIQVEFASFFEGEPFAFSTHPLAVSRENSERAKERILQIGKSSGAFEKVSVLFDLFDCFSEGHVVLKNGESSRILPAVRYIEEHCTESIYVEELAALCFISQSQLRRLFDREIGMSPTEFKNHKRMELAMNMLKYTYSRVGEVAESVGFDNIYVFSRLFTKHFGMSPLQYRKSLQKNQNS